MMGLQVQLAPLLGVQGLPWPALVATGNGAVWSCFRWASLAALAAVESFALTSLAGCHQCAKPDWKEGPRSRVAVLEHQQNHSPVEPRWASLLQSAGQSQR